MGCGASASGVDAVAPAIVETEEPPLVEAAASEPSTEWRIWNQLDLRVRGTVFRSFFGLTRGRIASTPRMLQDEAERVKLATFLSRLVEFADKQELSDEGKKMVPLP